MNRTAKPSFNIDLERRSIFTAFERFQEGGRDRSKHLLLREVWPAMSALVRELRQQGYDASIEEYLSGRAYPAIELIIPDPTESQSHPSNLIFRHSYGGLVEVYENCDHFNAAGEPFCSPAETLSPLEVTQHRVAEICWHFAAPIMERP